MKQKTHLIIDLNKIRINASRVVELCDKKGIEVLGVTKGCAAIPEVARAMIEGGVKKLADSRIENIISLRKSGFNQSITQLRIPGMSEIEQIIKYADCSLNSELAIIEQLDLCAKKNNKTHDIILMIDVGDLREGIMPEDTYDVIRNIIRFKGIKLIGIGTNLGCYGGVLPTTNNLGKLSSIAQEIRSMTGLEIPIVSGGGTTSLRMVKKSTVPKGITQLRVGEGILIGTDTTYHENVEWLEQNTFRLSAEVIEVKVKPSIPIGERGRNALGQIPEIEDKGNRKRAILALGRQDVNPEGLEPEDLNLKVLGMSYDHIIVDITDSSYNIKVGDHIMFKLNYKGMISLSDCNYIDKCFIE